MQDKFKIENPANQLEKSPEDIEIKKSKEKMDARVEILERHQIIFFSCMDPGSFENTVYGNEDIPDELKEKIRSTVTTEDTEWFIKGLGWDNPEDRKRFTVVNAIKEKNNYPELEGPSGIIIGGSPHMVAEGQEWMRKLQEYIRLAAERKVPILGVCFGHQMIAEAFGGEVGKTPHREFGTVQVDLTDEGSRDQLFKDLPKKLDVQMSHSDSVIELNEGIMKSLALNAHNINQAIKVGDNVRGIQFHPEMVKELIEALSIIRREAIKNEGLDIEQIMATIKNTPESQRVLQNFDKYFVLKYSQNKK